MREFNFEDFAAEWQEVIRRYCPGFDAGAAESAQKAVDSAARALDELKGGSPKLIQFYCRWRSTLAAEKKNRAADAAWVFLSHANTLLEYKQRIVFLRIIIGETLRGIKWEQ